MVNPSHDPADSIAWAIERRQVRDALATTSVAVHWPDSVGQVGKYVKGLWDAPNISCPERLSGAASASRSACANGFLLSASCLRRANAAH